MTYFLHAGEEIHFQQIANVMLNEKTVRRESGIFITIIIILQSAESSNQSF